jgi:hypothetical protein
MGGVLRYMRIFLLVLAALFLSLHFSSSGKASDAVPVASEALSEQNYGNQQHFILGPAAVTAEQAQAWARSRGATETFVELAPLYWRLAGKHGGVNPAGAYAQAAKETAFGRFGGVVDESFKNPCGLKTSGGGRSSDPKAHQCFSAWEIGVAAHLDHLALYAGAPGYPKQDTPDPRHFVSIKGKAVAFEDLGGKWAPSPDYGTSIVHDYLDDLTGNLNIND